MCIRDSSRDGHQNTCQGHENTFSIATNSLLRYDKVAIVVYHNRTGIFGDAKVIDVKALSRGDEAIDTIPSNELTILWPRYTTITTNTIDIHYYRNNIDTSSNGKVCSRVSNLVKNNINSDSSRTTITNDDAIKCHHPAHIISINDFTDSEYCVHLYNYDSDNADDDSLR